MIEESLELKNGVISLRFGDNVYASIKEVAMPKVKRTNRKPNSL